MSKSKIYLVSLNAGLLVLTIHFISAWIGLIHEGEEEALTRLGSLAFYYYSPIGSWILLTYLALALQQHFFRKGINWSSITGLCAIIILSSPFIRVFDVLLDFGIRYMAGMITYNPIEVLPEVWLVIISSSPDAMIRVALVVGIVFWINWYTTIQEAFTIKAKDGVMHKLQIHDVLYIQSSGNYVKLHVSGEEIIARNTLSHLQSELPGFFVRVHRSIIVNSRHIRSFQHWRNGEYLIKLEGGKYVTSSRSYSSNVKTLVKSFESGSFRHSLATIRH